MAGVAGLAATGCSAESSLEATDAKGMPIDPAKGGEWTSAACWHNCGGRCMNKVMVKDGAVIRQKTDDTHEDSFDYPQQRGCVRGKAQQQQCFGADRLKYPIKRKTWSPENPNGEMRGKDEWERISWDEAINYIGDQFKTIKEKYGNQAFLLGSYGSRLAFAPLLAWGGHTSTADTTSHGAYLLNTADTIGIPRTDAGVCNDRTDMLNADTIVFYASNPAWSAAGTPSYHYIRAKEAGVKFITVDPIYTASAQMLDAEWIPIRTGTDTAFLLGVASEMIRLDKAEGDIVDWEFLDKYTVGFDADHKPEDLKEDVNFADYLEGKYDGVKHDAEWASAICGVPVEKITWFAREIGKKKNVWLLHNFAAARCDACENVPQLFMTLGAMGGHMGKPGNCTANNYHANAGNGGPALVKGGSSGYPSQKNEIDGVIPGPQVWEACLTGKYRMVGDWYSGKGSQAGEDRTCDIHCIIHDENAYLQTGPNMKRGIEAHRKMDFVLSKAQFMTTQAMYSDIVLPVTTQWEVPGGLSASNREFLFCFSQVTEPLFEAKTDVEINSLIMEAIGVDPKTVYPISPKQAFFNSIAGATVIADDDSGKYVPLVTVTEADLKEWGVEGKTQTGRVGLNEFVSNGGYQVERKKDDKYSSFLGYASFIKDPEKNPLKTKSGKFEITCQAKVHAPQALHRRRQVPVVRQVALARPPVVEGHFHVVLAVLRLLHRQRVQPVPRRAIYLSERLFQPLRLIEPAVRVEQRVHQPAGQRQRDQQPDHQYNRLRRRLGHLRPLALLPANLRAPVIVQSQKSEFFSDPQPHARAPPACMIPPRTPARQASVTRPLYPCSPRSCCPAAYRPPSASRGFSQCIRA